VSDLGRRRGSVVVTGGGEGAALAARAATPTTPIAFVMGGDPVKLGLAASYSRPGANATGISILTATMEPKRLEILRELVPQVSTIGAFLDPNFPPYEDQLRDLRAAAHTLDLQVHEFRCSTDADIDLAFKTVVQQRIGAIMVTAGPFFDTRRDKLVTLAAHYAVVHVSFPRICCSWRANKLWGRCPHHLSPDRSLCGRDPQGGQARRVAYLWGASRRMVATRLSNSIELLAPCGNGLLALALLRMRGHAHAW